MWRRPRIYMLASLLLMVPLAWLLSQRGNHTEQIDSYATCSAAGYPVMDTDPPTCSDGYRTFLGPQAAPTPSAPAVSSADFQILVEGDSGGSYPKKQEVITTPAEWQKYWDVVHSGLKTLPPILPVDFTQSNVLALSEGRQSTGGYNLKVTGIQTTAAGTSVNVEESIPGFGCNVPATPSNRYFIARTAKLPATVSFRITTIHRTCP